MKVTFKKIIRKTTDIDFQKIHNCIFIESGKTDWIEMAEEFENKYSHYLLETHDLTSLFDDFDYSSFSFDDNEDAVECIVHGFYVWLEDKNQEKK